jgi:hypothetical protein
MSLLPNPVIKRGLTICGITALAAVVMTAWSHYAANGSVPVVMDHPVAATGDPEPVAPVQYPPSLAGVAAAAPTPATAVPLAYGTESTYRAQAHHRSNSRRYRQGSASRAYRNESYYAHRERRKHMEIIGGSAAGGALVGGLAGGGKGALIGGALGGGGGYLYTKKHHHHRHH